MIVYWFLYYFVEINVFDVKPVPRRFGDEIWPKMTPSWGPKTAPNRYKIHTENWSNFRSIFDRFLGAQEADFCPAGFGVGGRGVGHPLYFPYGSTRDFEEIECNIPFMINKMSPRDFTRRSSGSAAGLRTPAASHRPLTYFGYVRWVKF